MLIPIRHENMEARRWPVITIGLIVLNTVIFVVTTGTMDKESPELGSTKAHIILLAAAHPDLNMTDQERELVDNFKQDNPTEWEHLQSPMHNVIDGWDARMRLKDDPHDLQAEMDMLGAKYAELSSASIIERYAFTPAHKRAITYLTANFLHGGWLHLIGNMWFLWLAGFVLEDVWGRPLYLAFYLVGGAVALQIHAWSDPASIVPCVGASGAVAALMGAFLTRFPKMKIEMMWIFGFFRTYRFQAAAYWLLPLWVLMEVFYGALFGKMSGVAHWAHVGGFAFGALGAFLIDKAGLEGRVNAKVEKEISWTNDPEMERANQLVEAGQLDEAIAVAKQHVSTQPNSIDAWNLLRQIYWRRQELPAYHEATAKTCELQLRAKNPEGAWKDYEDFRNSGGEKLPAVTWLEICCHLEEEQNYDRAISELESLSKTYPSERQSLMAQMAAARICLKRLNRPDEALKFYEAAAQSPVPHLDLEASIEAGRREAAAAAKQLAAAAGSSAGF
ncbi:MAG TPA: rhomboid family intramembrane serine protease [Terriglobales bacterium]|nr:rhomboid family intramembrane serine protease [Terriglobales bacterium]